VLTFRIVRDANTKAKFPHSFNYEPPNDIGSCFYPARGPYSSSDPDLIDQHMQELKDYVVVVSWWGTYMSSHYLSI
jgi:glycoprotein endo-alpha-1,2-mannosidase